MHDISSCDWYLVVTGYWLGVKLHVGRYCTHQWRDSYSVFHSVQVPHE